MHGCDGEGGTCTAVAVRGDTCTAVTGKGARKGKSGEGARGGLMEGQLVEAITAAAQLHAAQLVLHPGISCAQRLHCLQGPDAAATIRRFSHLLRAACSNVAGGLLVRAFHATETLSH